MTKSITGSILLIIAFSLTLYWFDYKLLLILFIALTGNNFEQSRKY